MKPIKYLTLIIIALIIESCAVGYSVSRDFTPLSTATISCDTPPENVDLLFEGEKIDAFRRAVDQADQESIVAYQMIRKNHYPSHDYDSPFFSYPFYPDMQTRLFRKMDQIFFSGRVHEGVVQSINTSGIGGIGRIPVCIHHHMFRGNQNKYEEEKKNMYDRLSQMDGGHK